MEEFYKMKIRDGQRGKYDKKNSRHINGLRYEIQDEFNMMIVRIVENSYQIALKSEEKFAKKQIQRKRGRSINRGKGVSHGKA
jgi:hypothetical protein